MWAWQVEQQEIDTQLERLREEQPPGRRITRGQRQSAPDGSYLQYRQPQSMATAPVTDDMLTDDAVLANATRNNENQVQQSQKPFARPAGRRRKRVWTEFLAD